MQPEAARDLLIAGAIGTAIHVIFNTAVHVPTVVI